MSRPQKVVEGTKLVGYRFVTAFLPFSGVIMLGVGLMGAAMYFLTTELMESTRFVSSF